jgi:hyperosmotically inducible protein
MCKALLKRYSIALLTIAIFAPPAVNGVNRKKLPQGDDHARIIKEVRQELVTLPYYGVFDWIEYEVRPDNTAVLRGWVVRPTTKSDAEARVRKIPGVTRVSNEIEVLPPSPEDDRLRLELYRAIYNWDSPLLRYGTQAIPSIHIIVKNGRAILKGIVDSKADADLAYIKARAVPGLFDVKNELQVEGAGPR